MSYSNLYRLFSWEHSYFSGKARAYLRYKAHAGTLEYEDILATQVTLRRDGPLPCGSRCLRASQRARRTLSRRSTRRRADSIRLAKHYVGLLEGNALE